MVVKVYKDSGDKLEGIGLGDISSSGNSIMSIDGSTTTTGIAIIRLTDLSVGYALTASREKASETPVQYKVRLKECVLGLLRANRGIVKVFYEEPFIGYMGAAKNLLMLRTFVEELKAENETELNYLQYYEVNNMMWKKAFLAPLKCPAGSKLQKEAVKTKLVQQMEHLSKLKQDAIDAIALGLAAIKLGDKVRKSRAGNSAKYNLSFIGADNDEDMVEVFNDREGNSDGGNQTIKIRLIELKRTDNFEKCAQMVLEGGSAGILKFNNNHQGNIILKNRLGDLASEYKYLYAVINKKN